jgi:hypothetical protein
MVMVLFKDDKTEFEVASVCKKCDRLYNSNKTVYDKNVLKNNKIR